ncbi:MAG TPA: histidine--tRNA ligase [Steroidobacteraceae bacterium]|nr:histidine--tRNA ligase [Steroidobacteraceae bacterium]
MDSSNERGPALQSIRGMNDILPADIGAWQRLEQAARELFAAYGYQELRVPIVEQTSLFKRSIGEYTDVVSKEMYSFEDRGGEHITLRPEATAGVVRAMIVNGLIHNQRQRVWTSGPMFRYEKPQKGRFRQFYQLDVEAFGYAGPDVDAEMIMMSARLWRMLGIQRLSLNINSLGTPEARRGYREKLQQYFSAHREVLDEDSLRRLEGNPMRILDSKNPALRDVITNAPLLTDHLDPESLTHFDALRAQLDGVGIEYIVNPRLVRGLDYYSRTVFEWITTELGAQDAVCSGGRYDGLVAQLGGDSTPGIGWALGEERLVALMQLQGIAGTGNLPDVCMVIVGERAEVAALKLAEQLRDTLPALKLETLCGGGSFKSQLKRADKSGAQFAVILGDSETEKRVAGLKSLRVEAPQIEVGWDALAGLLKEKLLGS